MSGLLSWRPGQAHPMLGMAAAVRWGTLWGIGYNTAAGLATGNDLNTLLVCVWAAVYILATQWASRTADKYADALDRYDRGLSNWNPVWPA